MYVVRLLRMAWSRTLDGKNTYSVYNKPPVFSRWLFDFMLFWYSLLSDVPVVIDPGEMFVLDKGAWTILNKPTHDCNKQGFIENR